MAEDIDGPLIIVRGENVEIDGVRRHTLSKRSGDGPVILVEAGDVDIHDIEVLGYREAIRFDRADGGRLQNTLLDAEVDVRLMESHRVNFRYVEFGGDRTNIWMTDSDYGEIEGCTFGFDKGIFGDSCHRNVIRGCYFDALHEPILLVDSNENVIQGNIFEQSGAAGIHLTRCYATTVDTCGVRDGEGSDGLYAVDSRRTVVTNSRFERNYRSGVRLTRCDDSVVTGNRFEENRRSHIAVSRSDDVTVTANLLGSGRNFEFSGTDDMVSVGNR
ncbi:NosD domain-containing protein [Halorarius litoreus]|uniref:NosD domain-containing protein n=1 Tax=Halorarius litoreus TaxID=2962676 RepID=UPI0020CC2A15|nr:right-handed parallel beta-helix repeat-containing protein [Halorarius litoreus]